MKIIGDFISKYIRRLNYPLILLSLALCGASVFLLHTMWINQASHLVTDRQAKMQLGCSVVGLMFALIIAAFDYKHIVKLWYIYLPGALILQCALFVPSLRVEVSGADDIGWLDLGFTTIQPSEFLKIAFIMAFSFHLSKVGEKMNNIFHLGLLVLHGMIPAGLIALQGDDGTMIVFLGIFTIMLFAAGLWWRYVIVVGVMVPLGCWVLWNHLLKPFQKIRFQVVYDKAIQISEIRGFYYQQYHALIALGSGEMNGKGIKGEGYTYIPVVESDFIFSYVGMTFGFVGCIVIIGLLFLLSATIIRTSFASKDNLGKNICVGVFALVFIQSVINIGMVLSVVPVVGIPLPFVSAGGTQVLALFIDLGLVLSVYSHRYSKKKHMFYEEKEKATVFRI